MEFYLKHGTGTAGAYAYQECKNVQHKKEPLDWQKRGLSYTASGYGAKIPTEYKIYFEGRWRRVYVAQYSNNGRAYIVYNGSTITVDSY